MRILMLNHNLRGFGTWHRPWQLGRELARRGHGVTIWTVAPHHYYRVAREEREGVTVVETPGWSPWVGGDDGWGPLGCAWRSLQILREPFDLCYAFAHPPNVALPAWLARFARRRPVLYDWCDWYAGGVFAKRAELRRAGLITGERPLQRWAERREAGLERWWPRWASRVTVISEFLRDLTLAAGRRPEEVLLLPNGADLAGIRPQDPAACRRELGLPADGLYVSYIANYHPDQELLLEALARAAVTAPGLRLIKTGPPFAASLVERLGLGGRIVDLGNVAGERLPAVLGAADVLALPLADNDFNRSRMPYKFTDYLAAGRPIATCRVGDLARYFGNDAGLTDGGLHAAPIGLAGEPSVEGLGAALSQLLAPGADRAAMSRAARALAEREFTWSGLVDRLEGFIAEWR